MAAEPALEPIPVCQATVHWKDYTGKSVALLGRYSFRETGRQKGRWLDEEACDGRPEGGAVRLTPDAKTAPKPPDQIAIDGPALETQLTLLRQRTALRHFRFGSADYDRWAVVFGRLEGAGGDDLQLEYRGDGAVFFIADK